MGMHVYLGNRKRKKALLRNDRNLEEIYKMYHEKILYEIIYLEGKVIKEKYKYTVKFILEKFHINSNSELIFLLFEAENDVLGVCSFCGEEIRRVNIRSGERIADCGHNGICNICDKPSRGVDENGICYMCKPDVVDPRSLYQRRLEHALFYVHDACQLECNYTTEEEIDYVVDFLERKLETFHSLRKRLKIK